MGIFTWKYVTIPTLFSMGKQGKTKQAARSHDPTLMERRCGHGQHSCENQGIKGKL